MWSTVDSPARADSRTLVQIELQRSPLVLMSHRFVYVNLIRENVSSQAKDARYDGKSCDEIDRAPFVKPKIFMC